MPDRSRGCQTCKTRRIKCDEAKPTCQRCAKSRRVCIERAPGREGGISFHTENRYASGMIKRPRGPRSSLHLFRPNIGLLSHAQTYYLNYYLHSVVDLSTVSACMSECITLWRMSGRKSSMVDLAVSSLALAIFSRTQRCPPAAKEAILRYSLLLRVAQEQITQAKIMMCDEKFIDESLLTIVLMAWYETSMHRPAKLRVQGTFPSLHSWSHYDGGMAVLKVWCEQLSHSLPSSIIKQARRGMIRSALLRNCMLPNWVEDGNRYGEHSLDLGFDTILVRAANLRHVFKITRQKKRPQVTEVTHLIALARELDEACQEWVAQIPSAWSYQSHCSSKSDSWPRLDFYSSVVYIYNNPGYASIWMQYFAVQMLIDSTHLMLLQLSHAGQLHDSTYQQQHHERVCRISNMANSLASTIPFSLGRFQAKNSERPHSQGELTITLNVDEEIQPALALPTVWPLSMASGLDGLKPEQSLWFRAQIARLGWVLGDGALECAGAGNGTHDN